VIHERHRNGELVDRTVQTCPSPATANDNGRTAPRRRGAGRPRAKAGSRSSSSLGDDSDEPEPPKRRLCALCNRDIPPERAPQAKYCSEQHAERDRKRRTRARNRERAVKVGALTWRNDHLGGYRIPPAEADELLKKLRRLAECRCNGRHMVFADWADHCVRCGRDRKAGVVA
jgi:hypothetical protein